MTVSHAVGDDSSEQLALVEAFALDIYRDIDKVRLFLDRPHAMLGGKMPRDFALADRAGAGIVKNLLGRMAYGGIV